MVWSVPRPNPEAHIVPHHQTTPILLSELQRRVNGAV